MLPLSGTAVRTTLVPLPMLSPLLKATPSLVAEVMAPPLPAVYVTVAKDIGMKRAVTVVFAETAASVRVVAGDSSTVSPTVQLLSM